MAGALAAVAGAAVAGAAVAVAALPGWLLAPADSLPARFGRADCGRVELVDPRTGWRISGAEDLALAPDGTLIVAAHDRFDPALPDGGLYALDPAALAAGGTATARPLDRPRPQTRFRPHGLALSPDGRRLALVNRTGPEEAVVEIGALGPEGWSPERQLRDPRLCRANDLDFAGLGDTVEITLDRADCATSLRDLRGGTGSVLRAEGDRLAVLRTGLDFPNGIHAGHLAETRSHRLLRPDGSALDLPGAPDNLAPAPHGLVVAVHPSLLRTWLYLQGWSGHAPARILRIDAGGAIELLYDDPAGTLFSAATAAVLAGNRLVAGSVGDAGLLVCGPAKAP
jgi:hypothetical protein